MREILFKAKRLDDGEWVEGNLIFSADATENWKTVIIPITNSNMFAKENAEGNLGFENWYRVDPGTVCEYTGVLDDNCVKIFKGDIVREYDIFGKDKGVKVVKWDEFFSQWNAGETGLYGGIVARYKVLGNIFDNPELMESEVQE